MIGIEKVKQAAEGFYSGTVIVYEFMDGIYKNLLNTLINPSKRDVCLLGLFLRCLAWMKTLSKLNEPTDFQAIVTCNRSLLETTVDMILLHYDKSDESWWRMYWWERSEKLEAAEKLEKFYRELGTNIPSAYEIQIEFINNEKANILHMRKTLWPNFKGQHPRGRWNGSRYLLKDIKKADGLMGQEIKRDFGTTLSEFHATEYARLNWNIHGSALGGVRGISPEGVHIICALAFKHCADLAMICTKVILTDYDFATLFPEIRNKWERIKEDQLIAYGRSVGYL